MGMIQIDIPMPENCYDCPCSTFDDIMDEVECNIVNDAWFIPEETAKKGRLNNCPLKEVPETNVGKWISVKDRMPDEQETYLIFRKEPFGAVTIAWYSGSENGWLALDGGFYADGVVTHWMPLPEPPKEGT